MTGRVAAAKVHVVHPASASAPWTLDGGPASGAFSPGKAHLTLSWQGSDNFTTDSGDIDIDVPLTPYRP